MKNKSVILLSLLLMVLVITGCSGKDTKVYKYTFTGENELWSGDYKVDGKVTFYKEDGTLKCVSSHVNVLTVTCKKDISELAGVKDLSIEYDTTAGGGKLTEHYDTPPDRKVFTFKDNGNGAFVTNKDAIIKVTITVDGKSQLLELKQKK
ncbi:MAG: hypothetical protein AB9844_03100 [Clostridiaceae bacterium]